MYRLTFSADLCLVFRTFCAPAVEPQSRTRAIDIAKKMNVKHYALSFTSTYKDVLKFNKLLKGKVKIFKIETRNAIKNLNKIMSKGKKFLIDRGDLSKAVSIEMLPTVQRKVLKAATIKKKEVYGFL